MGFLKAEGKGCVVALCSKGTGPKASLHLMTRRMHSIRSDIMLSRRFVLYSFYIFIMCLFIFNGTPYDRRIAIWFLNIISRVIRGKHRWNLGVHFIIFNIDVFFFRIVTHEWLHWGVQVHVKYVFHSLISDLHNIKTMVIQVITIRRLLRHRGCRYYYVKTLAASPDRIQI